MHASHDLAPGGRGLATLFHGSPSVGELREDHQEFWILLFQLQQWKRTFFIQQLLLGCLRPHASLCSEHSTLLLPVLQTLLKRHLPPESLACSAQVRDEPPHTHVLHGVLHMAPHSHSSFPHQKCCDTCPSFQRDSTYRKGSCHISQSRPGHLGHRIKTSGMNTRVLLNGAVLGSVKTSRRFFL